jgi:hypothetical protein
MKVCGKLTLAFLGTFLSLFCSTQCLAQPGINNIRSDKPREDNRLRWVRMNNQWVLMTNDNKVDDLLWNWNKASGKHKYQVTLKDSSVKETLSYMYTDTISHKSFLLFEDKKVPKSDTAHHYQMIYTDQTLYISTIVDLDANTEVYGVPNDTCWAFKVISGPISVYAKSFNYLTLAKNLNENEFDIPEIVGVQLNDGPIVKLTHDNLKQMIGQDTNALETLEEKKYYKAVKKYNRHAEKDAKK